MKTNFEMAREAGFCREHINIWMCTGEDIKRFAALVAAAEQKKWEDQTAVEIHEAILDEREACTKVCEKQIKIFLSPQYKTGQPLSSFFERHAAASCAEAIRARGQA
jgi:hypothetical protein